ncbi:MAG TPA: transcription-repair coupling factor [Terriglobales bacterium]|nr:transcription-repair coupling factor [Terriglobales bacterium]
MVLPFVRELFADVEKLPAFARATSHLKSGAGRIILSGLTPSAKTLLLPMLRHAAGKPLIVVVADNRAADEMLPTVQAFADLSGGCDPSAVVALPAHDVLPYENLSPHPEIQEKQAITLWKMAMGQAQIVLVPARAAAMRFRAPEFYGGLARVVRRGESVDAEQMLGQLAMAGYTRTDVVEMPGEFAQRGGIVDVYPPEAERPVRLELFGDEVESIRRFDPGTQRSLPAPLDETALLPLTPTPVEEATLGAIHARLSGRRIAGTEEIVEQSVREAGVSIFPGWELYAPLAYLGDSRTVFEMLPNALALVDEPDDVQRELDGWWERLEQTHERSGVGALARPEELYLQPETLRHEIARRGGVELEQLGLVRSAETSFPRMDTDEGASGAGGQDPHPSTTDGEGVGHPRLLTGAEAPIQSGGHDGAVEAAPLQGNSIQFTSQTTPRFHGSVAAMAEEVKKLSAAGTRVVIAAANMGEVERLADIFAEYGVPFRLGTRAPRPGETYVEETSYFAGNYAAATIVRAYVPDGVALPDAALAVFGSRDLFDESEAVAQRPQRSKSKTSAFLSDFRDLAVGDYVVHVEHGIGQYQGLKEIAQPEGANVEFMVLEYAEGARLYVPLTRLDLVQKYRSAEGAKPVLNRLGTGQWAKTKARVKKAMKDMADELLKLYAARKTAEGHAFPPDTEWQREFEDQFEFNETEDQLTAIVDVKHDMESPQPMDRLLCGDVGYGKTEVAMRAAFKAVSDNRQVAVLAPTTVLAFQHFETFKQRMAAFPIKIEMLSRFRSAKQQREIVEKVEAGQVDVLIGTHRLLSKDIKFHDLGLVVVDEEQRFGVRHKERLKQLKKEVDVLTMSATPIPRTLHMSMVGLRDMSVIETPPKDRIAIQTVVAAWDEALVRSALEHELERGGQVYFVHNRVESIYEIAAKLQELVPRARILVGHGQMSEGELEKVMLSFIRHEADILVATTIIENGLDIPLCNTMIVNRADRHGLSELYQLRGRVGRSNRRAYAYLLVPAEVELTPIARRRLAALKEFSDLGAGFKIAALDLELRGAGNLLGGEQSGHIDAVGFEMYTAMLDRTIRELKGEEVAIEAETQLNLGLNIRIPGEYIAEENQRLRMYKRVAGVENELQLADVIAEMQDRYGEPPRPVGNLFEYARLRLLAQRVGVAAIDRKRDQVSIKFSGKAAVDLERLARFVAGERGAQFTPQGVLTFALKTTRADQVLARLRELLNELAGVAVAV